MILSLFYQFFAIIKPINFHLYHYAGNNPVRYVDPDGRALPIIILAIAKEIMIGGFIGAVTCAGANYIVQVGSNVIEQVVNGQEVDFLGACKNIDFVSVKNAAIGGAISGAITGGVSSISNLKNVLNVSMKLRAVLNSSANVTGTAVSTIKNNLEHGVESTDGLCVNIMVAGVSGITTGILKPNGINVISRNADGVRTMETYYSKEIADVISTVDTVVPNTFIKESSVTLYQEVTSTTVNSLME